jgi:N-acetylglucosamine-6-phosphate deacetylase
MALTALTGPAIFDGDSTHHGAALVIDGGRIAGIVPRADLPPRCTVRDIGDGWLAPGLVDLQVNGGGGVLLNDDPTAAAMARIARAHAGLGTTAILPTLITDSPATTAAAIAAARAALAAGVPGIAGLHLEGPHLSVARKGAHDPALIRPMAEADMDAILDAAADIPALLSTLAPESVTPDQIARLTAAGVVVSLGHTDAGFDRIAAAVAAGARSATHLFNAMGQLGNREPGLVGAVLDMGDLSAGLIADGFHVHPAAIRAALRAKRGPGEIYLVSDAMATVGSDLTQFDLNGRRVFRRDGRLTLADGTLAGADIDLLTAVRFAVAHLEMTVEQALARAGRIPARLMRLADRGHLHPGARADIIHLRPDLSLAAVWQGGAAPGQPG